jgi:hypothetical protein
MPAALRPVRERSRVNGVGKHGVIAAPIRVLYWMPYAVLDAVMERTLVHSSTSNPKHRQDVYRHTVGRTSVHQ